MKKTAKHYKSNPASRAKKAAYDKAYNKKTVSDRVARNKARREAIKSGKAKKGDGKDVHHPKGLLSPVTVVMSASKNRGIKEKSRKKGSKRK